MKKKDIIAIITAIVCIAAAVTAIILFREQIKELIDGVKTKAVGAKTQFTNEECKDFADI